MFSRGKVRFGVLLALVTGLACGHTLRPLYEDYRIDSEAIGDQDIRALIAEAVVEAGWTLDEPDAPNVVSTEEATVTHWGLYKLVASIDVVPIGAAHVRVYVHPYRVYVWGSRSKMPYMSGRVRRFVMPGLTETLADRGIIEVEVDLAEEASR